MGYKYYYSGTLPDVNLQEKVINFIQNSYPSSPDLIVKPYPDIKYDVRVYYGKSVDEAGQIHSCCNDFCHENVCSPWNGVANVEQIVRDYPCNYFGIIQFCNRRKGTINGGEFIFDRTAGGILINISKLFPIYLDNQMKNENKDIPEPESMVQLSLRRVECPDPFLLNIIKLRWWPDLVCFDDEDFCQESLEEIRKYGLTKKLMDENLDYGECLRLLLNREPKKYFFPLPTEQEIKEKSTPEFIYEKEFLEAIEKTRDLIEICKEFVKSAERRVNQYEDCIKQYPSNHNYKSCLEEAQKWLADNKGALQHYKETFNEELEIYKKYYGRKETLH